MLNQWLADDSWAELTAGAHRLRGVAANLGLLELQGLLATLEQAAQQRTAEEARQSLDALPPAWLRAEQALLRLSAAESSAALSDLPSAVTASLPAEQVMRLMQEISSALERGMLPEQALGVLQPILPAATQTALMDAIDCFDFQSASTVLQDWHSTSALFIEES